MLGLNYCIGCKSSGRSGKIYHFNKCVENKYCRMCIKQCNFCHVNTTYKNIKVCDICWYEYCIKCNNRTCKEYAINKYLMLELINPFLNKFTAESIQLLSHQTRNKYKLNLVWKLCCNQKCFGFAECQS